MARPQRRRETRRSSERSRPSSAGRSGRTAARGGSARAMGDPSPALLKAAAWERAYVVKDFRRIGITIVAMLVLLALAGFAENALLR